MEIACLVPSVTSRRVYRKRKSKSGMWPRPIFDGVFENENDRKNLRKHSVSFLPSEESEFEFLENVIFSRHPLFKPFPDIGKFMYHLMP